MHSRSAAFRTLLAVFIGVFALAPLSSSAAGLPFTADLYYGMHQSTQVSELQDYLRAQGYFNYETTGNFISITLAAVKAWQTAHCVPSTGYFGPISRQAASLGTLCSAASSTPSTPVASTTSASAVSTSSSPHIIGGGYSVGGPSPVTVSVIASSTQLDAFATTTLVATVTNAATTTVNWSASAGSITPSGVFTAPSFAATTTVTVIATSAADNSTTGSATITVVPIIVSVTPDSPSVAAGTNQTFTASVLNATSSAVTWSVSGGTISSTGIFTAPGNTSTTTYTVTASSTLDASRAATVTVQVTPNTDFVGWWPLNEGTSTIAYDQSGGGNNGGWTGTPSGNTGYYDTNAAPHTAYAGTFDGSDDLVTIPNINIGAAQTISFWAYIPSLSSDQELVSKSSAGQGVEFLITGGTMTFYVMGSQVNHAAANSSDIHLNAWNYITGTYDGPDSTVTLYINGVQSGSTTTAPDTIGNVQNLYFGNWTSGGRWFIGKLNDVRMYTNEFTPQQVLNLYNSLR